MKKAGVVLDKWKLSIFKKHLTKAGFEYKKRPGVNPETLTLVIYTEEVDRLKNTLQAAQQECARSHLH